MGAVPVHAFTAQALNDGEQMALTSRNVKLGTSLGGPVAKTLHS